MIIGNSTKISFSNYTLIFKLLLYFLILALIICLFVFLVYIPSAKPIINDIKATGVFENIKIAGKQFLNMEGGYTDTLNVIKDNFIEIDEIFSNSKGRVAVFIILVLAFIAVGKFISNYFFYGMANQLNKYMNSCTKTKFMTNLVINLKQASMYSLMHTVISFPVDILIVYLNYLLFINLVGVIGIFTPAIVLGIAITLWCFKYTFFAEWLPCLLNVENITVLKALNQSFKLATQKFWSFYGLFWLYMLAGVILLFTVTLTTYGLGLPFTLALISIIYVSAQFVIYYENNDKRYYVNDKEIITPLQNI